LVVRVKKKNPQPHKSGRRPKRKGGSSRRWGKRGVRNLGCEERGEEKEKRRAKSG